MLKLPVPHEYEISGEQLADFLRRATTLVRLLPASAFAGQALMEAVMLSDALQDMVSVAESDVIVRLRREAEEPVS